MTVQSPDRVELCSGLMTVCSAVKLNNRLSGTQVFALIHDVALEVEVMLGKCCEHGQLLFFRVVNMSSVVDGLVLLRLTV